MQTLDLYDWIAIGVYFLVLAGIAVWVIRKKSNTTEDYKSFYYNKLFFNNISSLEAHSSRMLEVQGLEYYESNEVDLDNLTFLSRIER